MPTINKEQLDKMIAKAEEQRGFTVKQIDKAAFLERISWDHWSAQLIGHAFLSMYRTGIRCELDLMQVCNLDAEGKHFLFQAIFARDVPRWSCDFLYGIEQEIKQILNVEYVDDLIVKTK